MKPIKIFLFMAFLLVSIIAEQDKADAALKINYFSPTGGWVGTDYYNGTQVKIYGNGFKLDPNDNWVFFKNESGNDIQANVAGAFPDESKYKFETTIGQPGSGPGQLNNPVDIEIDSNGNIYIVNSLNNRVEVFDENGVYSTNIASDTKHTLLQGIGIDQNSNRLYLSEPKSSSQAHGKIFVYNLSGSYINTFTTGNLIGPRGIAVGSGGAVYVADEGGHKVVKYDSTGSVLKTITGPTANPFSYPVGIAYDKFKEKLYITDVTADIIYLYDKNDNYLTTWTAAMGAPQGITTDRDGYVYVAEGAEGISKFDVNGNTIARNIGIGDGLPSAVSVAVDKKKNIYAGENVSRQCINVYTPEDVGMIVVNVPPDSVTAPIKVEIGADTVVTENKFTVFKATEAQVEKVEVTQGVKTYPFVAGKDTLVYAKIKGLFGAPGKDTANVCIRRDNAICLSEDFDEFDEVEFTNNNSDTILKYHVPYDLIKTAGEYEFVVRILRNSQVLYDSTQITNPADQLKFRVENTKELNILFIRFTDVPNEAWEAIEPFPYFDMQTFLYSLKTMGRVYPLSHPPSFRFGENKFVAELMDKIDLGSKKESSIIATEVMKSKNAYSCKAGWQPDLAVGLIDKRLKNGTTIGQGAQGGHHAYMFFYKKMGSIQTFGNLLAHEIGHNHGLVPTGAPNESTTSKHHSKNFNLDAELGSPITVWNAMTDKLMPGSSVISIMAQGLGGLDDESFFESKTKNNDRLEYHLLFDKFKTAKQTSAAIAPAGAVNADDSGQEKIVMIGYIDAEGSISIGETYLTTSSIPVTAAGEPIYELVFLTNEEEVISREGFNLIQETAQGADEYGEGGVFNVVRLFPAETEHVDIRFQDQILIRLTQSQYAPWIDNVQVSDRTGDLFEISWDADDQDGDPLSYSVHCSTDGGDIFAPVATGLSETTYLWDHSLHPGSAGAVIRVIANDGFNRTGALSAPFEMAPKVPDVAILSPADGEVFTENHPIQLHGAAFDPEDGLISGDRLHWLLDGQYNLGTGDVLILKEILRSTPSGHISLPVAVGFHTLQLVAYDTDDNQIAAEVGFEVMADIDRDPDGDGIFSEIDTEPEAYSNGFDNGITFGNLIDRGDQEVVIYSGPDGGIAIEVVHTTGIVPASVEICNHAVTYDLDQGDAIMVNCENITTHVLSGSVGLTLLTFGGIEGTTQVGAPNRLTFNPETGTVSADENNMEIIVIIIQGVPYDLLPGFELMLDDPDGTCPGDYNLDKDVDGEDLDTYLNDDGGVSYDVFANNFGRTNCP